MTPSGITTKPWYKHPAIPTAILTGVGVLALGLWIDSVTGGFLSQIVAGIVAVMIAVLITIRSRSPYYRLDSEVKERFAQCEGRVQHTVVEASNLSEGVLDEIRVDLESRMRRVEVARVSEGAFRLSVCVPVGVLVNDLELFSRLGLEDVFVYHVSRPFFMF